MNRLIPLFCLALCVPAVAGDTVWKQRPFSDVDHWSTLLDDPERDGWQHPITMLGFLAIERGDTVADLGAGTGYFTKPLSIQVGPQGRVYAVDTQQSMLDHLMARTDVSTDRVVPVLAEKDDPRLPEGELDVIIVMNTWHLIKKRDRYLKRIEQALNEEGRLAIIDFHAGDLPVGPAAGRKLSREDAIAELEQAGWRVVAESVTLPYQYMLVVLPPAKRDTRRFLSR